MNVWIVWRQYSGGKTLVGVFEDERDAIRARSAYEAHYNQRYPVTPHAVTPARPDTYQPPTPEEHPQ